MSTRHICFGCISQVQDPECPENSGTFIRVLADSEDFCRSAAENLIVLHGGKEPRKDRRKPED